MKTLTQMLVVLAICMIGVGCSSSNEPTNNTNSLKGYIYYSGSGNIYRVKLSDHTATELFSNARHPEIIANGNILCIEETPVPRIFFSDLTGANRQTVIEGEGYSGPTHKVYMNRPRISYDQNYVVYEGDNISNPITYVVDASSGDLIVTIGDKASNQPLFSPSWVPDGSIVVQGETTKNNGIYKVAADFSSIVRIDPNLSNVSEPSVSPDGKSIAFIRDGKIWVMGIDGSSPTQLNTTATKLHMICWSPDSKYIAVVSSGKIHILDPIALTDTEITNSRYVDTGHQLSWVY